MTTLINRRVFLAATGLILAGASSAAPLTWGEHGMALFGGKAGLYASHLPMFHAPHDYQVILQVHVADAATDAALRKRLDGKTALWTIAPEKFELSRLAPSAAAPLRQFKADLVQGHFEQGGATQFAYWGVFFWIPAFLARPLAQGGAGMTVVSSLSWPAGRTSRCSTPSSPKRW